MKEFHPIANIYPLMSDEELDALAENIKANGLLMPIDVFEDKILDGRNRYLACLRAGVEPDCFETDCDGLDPLEYVKALNEARRHLNETQRAMLAARQKEWHVKKAKARQADHGGTAPGRPKTIVEDFPQLSGKARDTAGAEFDVSGKTVDAATKVVKCGSAELQRLCDQGKISVSSAAKIAELPKRAQSEIVKKAKSNGNPKKVIAQEAKRAAEAKQPRRYPASERFTKLMHNLAGMMESIRQDYCTMSQMLDSPDFDPSDIEIASTFVHSFADTFAQLSREMKKWERERKQSSGSK